MSNPNPWTILDLPSEDGYLYIDLRTISSFSYHTKEKCLVLHLTSGKDIRFSFETAVNPIEEAYQFRRELFDKLQELSNVTPSIRVYGAQETYKGANHDRNAN